MSFEPTEDDCKACTYDEHGYIITACQPCKELGQRALDFLISAKLLKKAHEGSA